MSQRKTYSLHEITHWQEQVGRLPQFIAEEEEELAQERRTLESLRATLSDMEQKQIAPLEGEVRGIQARVDLVDLPERIAAVEQQIVNQQGALERLRDQRLEQSRLLTAQQTSIDGQQGIIVYEEARLRERQLPAQINLARGNISRLRERRASLQCDCRALDGTITSLESSLSSLSLQQTVDYSFNHQPFGHHHHHSVYSSSHGHHGHHGHHHGSGFGDFVHTVSDVSRDLQISQLKGDIATERAKQRGIDRSIAQLDGEISTAESVLRQNENSLLAAQREVSAGARLYSGLVYSGDMNSLKRQLDEMRQRAAAARSMYEALGKESQTIEGKLGRLQNEAAGYRQTLLAAELISKPYAELEISEARELLAQKNAELSDWNNKRRLQLESIEQCVKNIVDAENSIQRMSSTLQGLQDNQFMQCYSQNSAEFTMQLQSALNTAISQYEFDHPARQCVVTRQLIHDLPYKAGFICRNSTMGNESYQQLTGLIYEAKRLAEQHDHQFSNALDVVLQTHLLSEDDAKNAYDTAKQKLVMPQDISAAALNLAERTAFNQEIEAFKQQCRAEPHSASSVEHDFYRKGRALLKAIESAESYDKRFSKDSFDYKFYTNILKNASQLMQNPIDHNLQLSMVNYAKYNTHGKSSTGRKVVGALGMFLGAAIVVASAIFGVLSMGIASAISIAGFSAGGGLFLLSLGLCLSGRQRGVDTAINAYHHAALFQPKPAPHPSESYFVPPHYPTAPLLDLK